jgi:hypothetical protein
LGLGVYSISTIFGILNSCKYGYYSGVGNTLIPLDGTRALHPFQDH